MKPRTHKFRMWRDSHWNTDSPYVTLNLDKVEAYSLRRLQYQETSFCNYEPRDCVQVRMTGGSEYKLWCTEEDFEKVYLAESPKEPKTLKVVWKPPLIIYPKHLRTGNPEDKGQWEGRVQDKTLNELCKKVED